MKDQKTSTEKETAKKTRPAAAKDKEKTMQRLINAVSEIVKTNGYEGLGVNKIARAAGADKKLIYRYFGSPENLIKAYLQKKDYWIAFSEQMNDIAKTNFGKPAATTAQEAGSEKEDQEKIDLKTFVSTLLTNQYQFFEKEEEMQQLILREFTTKNPLMDGIAQLRDDLGNPLLELTDEYFKNTDINFRAISALLVGGIYYLVLHAKVNTSTFCGIKLQDPEGRKQILQGIEQILDLAFEAGKKDRP